MRAVRTKRWKYIRRFDEPATPVLPNCDDGESKSVWLAHGWKEQSVAQESLFDLVFDPNETGDLAGDAATQSVLDEMRERLGRWMHETDDPLLRGNMPAPVGAVVNDREGLSPRDKPRNAQQSCNQIRRCFHAEEN